MQLGIMANSSQHVCHNILYSNNTFHIYIIYIANIPFGEDIEQKSNSAKKLYDVINKILEPHTN